jgi:glucan phosphoethanolaminetransferase (alkaline phosphatase superfamily)
VKLLDVLVYLEKVYFSCSFFVLCCGISVIVLACFVMIRNESLKGYIIHFILLCTVFSMATYFLISFTFTTTAKYNNWYKNILLTYINQQPEKEYKTIYLEILKKIIKKINIS